ncbi:malto-oligosyltrehalose trehalohydrolase [Marinilabilia salmonicolor]|jgi:maltooligosyltrehalose trehalohydrolase|uniref:Malto-oligosyltrehalose trehalohydrolase n=1 Tax=Marinilabilia salmonicolor TaxID=989 RepID=A0A368V8M0_9BACT|nr:malto-oligosyltrehalose trehalohydrolase [Marinilabilia salmonicolor]RCW37557.1 maltooligosyl trehalose hydrolase [Marinilabilia salmonicolor]
MTIKQFSQRPGISINRDSKTASALVWAPFAKTVALEINSTKKIGLSQSTGGYWEGHDLPLSPGDRYRCVIDDEALPDPASLSQPAGVHAPSEVIDLYQHPWDDQNWSGIRPEKLIIYELHVGTFNQEGTFSEIIPHLNRLRELGINAIELMPVAQFPGIRNWGYDGVFPYAVQNSYGGAGMLQLLVDECHKQGIAVILDVVYNHLGPEGNYLNKFGPYFTSKYKTPWGDAINFDDAFSDGVRHFFLENAMMWLRDFHIDGLRLDAVHAIKDFGARHFLAELKQKVEELNAEYHRNHFLIAECDLNDVRYINPFDKGGYNLDAQWCDEFHHALHAITTGEENGYYNDFGGTGPLEKSYNHAFVYDGIYSPHRKKIFGSSTEGQPGCKFVVFAQNHDQTGNRMLGDRLSQLVSFEMQKVIAAAYILSPFTPMLFMGEEYGEHNPFLYFVNHSDPKLIRNVQNGRKKEFKDFMTDQEPPDPQSEETFKNSRLTSPEKWNSAQQKLYDWYRFLIRLRKEQPFWQEDPRKHFKAETIGSKLIRLTYQNAATTLICLGNFGKEAESVRQSGKILESSASEKHGGPAKSSELQADSGSLNLPSESFTIILIS